MIDIRTGVRTTVNASMRPFGVRIERIDRHDWSDTANFIPLQATLDAATAASLPLGDYVDSVMNGVPGNSRRTVDKMIEWGALPDASGRIVEIGPGTGRYLEKIVGNRPPSNYEIYETARPWADYLAEKFGVTVRRADGYTLSSTADAAVDLVHAHKVFNGIPLMATLCYWREMARVLKPGGFAVFDIISEDCLDPETIDAWVGSKIRNGTYPTAIPLAAATSYFAAHGFGQAGSAVFEMPPGRSRLLAFRRSS